MSVGSARRGLWFVLVLTQACQPAPFGEVLVVVDTNVSVPKFARHLRIDLYDEKWNWYESRAVTTLDPSDWPVSFSLFTDDRAAKIAHLRLRSHPSDGLRAYLGEQFAPPTPYTEPRTASSLADLCDNAPALDPNVELTQRRGPAPLTEHLPQADCIYKTNTGSVAAKVHISSAGSYRFEVVRTFPAGGTGSIAGDTSLFLRRDCMVHASQLGCAEDIDAANGNYLSRLLVTLQPGDYYVITGGRYRQTPADVTLRWAEQNDPGWTLLPPGKTPSPPLSPPEIEPKLIVNGDDRTPTAEPRPNLAIDRTVEVAVEYGTRRTAALLLDGECFGVQSDLKNRLTCAGAQTLGDVERAPLRDGIWRGGRTQAGTWVAETTTETCTTSPPPSRPDLLDEAICIPPGAFLLGSLAGDTVDAPQQMVVNQPFFLDRNEFTVGRARQAMASGWSSPDLSPFINNAARLSGDINAGTRCTMNGSVGGPAPGVDRERFPLNCISWYAARSLCQFFGGDLPTAAQWEFAARAAGRATATIFPWGDEYPTCERAAYGGIAYAPDTLRASCPGNTGPFAVDQEPWASADMNPLGVSAMAGNVNEWMLDSQRDYADSCWWQHPLRGVTCAEVAAPNRAVRGGSWSDPLFNTLSFAVLESPPSATVNSLGFRCAYPGTTP